VKTIEQGVEEEVCPKCKGIEVLILEYSETKIREMHIWVVGV
jgi:Zn finger protein HypA/HybF involved in hydrogenase expression